LILDGVDRFDACKDLAGHHPRQRDKADRSHAVHDWHEAASQCVPQDRQQRLIPGTAKSEASFDGGPFAHQAIRQHVQAQAYPRHGVAQDHAQQWQRIARMVPRIRA
jgi:hypothetical protein